LESHESASSSAQCCDVVAQIAGGQRHAQPRRSRPEAANIGNGDDRRCYACVRRVRVRLLVAMSAARRHPESFSFETPMQFAFMIRPIQLGSSIMLSIYL
jgi:hypothetical protein